MISCMSHLPAPSFPVAPSTSDPRPLIIYHGPDCPDGFAAALAAWLFYGGQAQFLGLDHGDIKSLAELPAIDGRAVYILDFSFSADLLREIDRRAAKLVLLDHHKSAADRLQGFECRCGIVHFDMAKSGARLAWDFFQRERPVPDLVRFVEDRDIWVWQYPQSPGFLAALDLEPREFQRWNEIAGFNDVQLAHYVERGQAMDEKFKRLALDMAESARPLIFNGHSGLMANVPSAFHSEVGNILCQRSGSFGLLWTLDKNDQIRVGLRSRAGFNCIPLAQSMHGGGHVQACGFRMALPRLIELLSGRFEAGQ